MTKIYSLCKNMILGHTNECRMHTRTVGALKYPDNRLQPAGDKKNTLKFMHLQTLFIIHESTIFKINLLWMILSTNILKKYKNCLHYSNEFGIMFTSQTFYYRLNINQI